MRIILNPMARHGRGGRLRDVIARGLERRGCTFDIVHTEGPGHAADLAVAAAGQGIARVVAAGGDGTIHEVVNGLMAASAPGVALGLIPIGTGNDFVKMVPGTATPDLAMDTLARGTAHAVDIGIARWQGGSEYFANAMGTGIDVEVVRGMRRSRLLPGGFIYVSALLRALVKYRPLAVRIEVDGDVVEKSIMNLAVCNGPSIGGSFRICPDALTDDGLLDVCLVEEMPILRNARMVPRVIRGTHTGQRGVTMLRGRSIRLTLGQDRPLWFQLDGELREAPDGREGIHVTLAPERLNVIRAAAGSPQQD
ncbi:MAG TPA: diacylglycerol kinase family protein [Longimicrobiales bacterium]|nr:diacylglycerol kinase family protein [Longimicrobiales bacterium]